MADDLEHVGRRGLLLQRFPQLIEQPRVLDGDDGLSGEILHQLDLLVGEQADILAIDGNSANQIIHLEHRHQDERACPRELYQRGICMWIFCRNVGNVDDLLFLDEAADISWNRWLAPSKFFELTWSAMRGN